MAMNESRILVPFKQYLNGKIVVGTQKYLPVTLADIYPTCENIIDPQYNRKTC
jgi:hypothetical protein